MVYAVADSSNFFCNNKTLGSSYTRGAGRIARPMNLTRGGPSGPPCWLYQNEFTYGPLAFDKTVHGTQWGMAFCHESDLLNQVLDYPGEVPAWSSVLYNNKFYAADHAHDLQEPTHSVWDPINYGWQRFWRDISSTSNSMAVWTECTCNSSQWYPNDIPIDGNTVSNDSHPVMQTDITDAKTKQYFGYFSTPSNPTVRYLASNPRNNTAGDRFPLTLAWQGLDDPDDSWTFKHIGVVATNPANSSNKGFSYPEVVQAGDNLLVAYSENKQNIWVSVIPISSL
ncbi:hypothetical protein JCM24511_02105 [Saitozyma sp. JCM 24511]|nr:hypothetical protein JCM24511_02105 [Saitozyma sp. JCM 24511]